MGEPEDTATITGVPLLVRWWRSNFLKLLGKVVVLALSGSMAAGVGFWSTFQTLQTTVRAQGEEQKRLDREQQLAAIARKALEMRQAADDVLHASDAEVQKILLKQQDQMRLDLQYIQRELIGRVRRSGES